MLDSKGMCRQIIQLHLQQSYFSLIFWECSYSYHIIYHLFAFRKSVQDNIVHMDMEIFIFVGIKGWHEHSVYNNHMVIWYDKYRVTQKERMFWKWVVVERVSFFGVTSNQKSTFVNLVQSMIWKFPFAKKLQTVPQEMLVNAMQKFEERLRTCVRQEGRHLSDIIFP